MRVQHIPVETAGIGDVVTIVWKERDVTVTAHGRIGNIRPSFERRIFVSETGYEFASYNINNTKEVQCILHERKIDEPTELFSTDWIETMKEKI